MTLILTNLLSLYHTIHCFNSINNNNQCNPLQGIDDSYGIYAKIGCMERETFTSTKLQLILYTDNQCSSPYEDSQTAKKRAHRGYELNGQLVSSQVSFKPNFYSCLSCNPDSIANTFNKRNSNWYDDDYISEHGNKNNEENADDDYQYDDQNAVDDLYYSKSDDGNVNNNDDGNVNNDDDGYWRYSSYNAGDDYYSAGDDYYRGRRQLALSSSESNRGVIQVSGCCCNSKTETEPESHSSPVCLPLSPHLFHSLGLPRRILVRVPRAAKASLRE